MKVLIVDDSAVMRSMIKRMLANIEPDVETLEAGDGKAALAQLAQFPDLVVCDWNMPTMTGLEFLRALRAAANPIPVHMITTEAHFSKKREALDAGATGFLAKPFTPSDLAALIKGNVGTGA